MKTRNGFVSNSSSSSFVLIGYLVDKQECSELDLIEKIYTPEELDGFARSSDEFDVSSWEELDDSDKAYLVYEHGEISILSCTDDGIPEGKMAVGKLIRTPSYDCLEYSVTELDSVIEDLHKAGFTGPIQVITGTMCC